MTIVLRPKYVFKVPIDGRAISPDNFVGKRIGEIDGLELYEGNTKRKIGELFVLEEIKGTDEPVIAVYGDVKKVRRIGSGMTQGSLAIYGDVGLYAGEEMKEGNITVYGNAGSWLGTRMRNGTIEVYGNAGDQIGSAYRGSTRGMRGGTITIHGDAGSEVGSFMRGGTIRVEGSVGLFPGSHMNGGTVFVKGDCDGEAGASMKKGNVIVCGGIPSILPSFSIEGISKTAKVGAEKVPGPFYRFEGDHAEGGRGRLYVSTYRNTHLKSFEKFL